MRFHRLPTALLLGLAAVTLSGASGETRLSDLGLEVDQLLGDQKDLVLGVQVWLEGEGEIYAWLPDEPRAAASSIKTAVALDLLIQHAHVLDVVPAGLDAILRVDVNPAFDGFTAHQLGSARRDLKGKTYWDLALIMMGRTADVNEVYNAACNFLMVKLGGPEAIERRVHRLDPAFAGFDLNRYMKTWNGDGDNRASPRALVTLYRMLATREVPDLDEAGVERLRTLLLDSGDGRKGSVFEKGGTLFPKPMVRVRAGFVERDEGNLVFAVMGEVPGGPGDDPTTRFVSLMNGVDAITARCTEWAQRGTQ